MHRAAHGCVVAGVSFFFLACRGACVAMRAFAISSRPPPPSQPLPPTILRPPFRRRPRLAQLVPPCACARDVCVQRQVRARAAVERAHHAIYIHARSHVRPRLGRRVSLPTTLLNPLRAPKKKKQTKAYAPPRCAHDISVSTRRFCASTCANAMVFRRGACMQMWRCLASCSKRPHMCFCRAPPASADTPVHADGRALVGLDVLRMRRARSHVHHHCKLPNASDTRKKKATV